MSTAAHRRPINILSLDGGGVRGLSSLLLLRGLMERLAIKKGIVPPAILRPCDCFDFIIGAGTGGISALFLGRMGMTVDEAINAYLRMAETAFEPPTSSPFSVRLWREMSTLDGRMLQHVIGDIVQEMLGDRDARMENCPSGNLTALHCRTAVLAATSAYADAPPYVFRSYNTRQPGSQYSIVDVAHATIAITNVFTPVLLGTPPVKFIDAGLAGYNNPVEIGLSEAAEIWEGRDINCVVSLGTGLQPVIHSGIGWDQVAKSCMGIVQSCELVHDRTFRARLHAKLPYFRFNVDRGLGNVELTEWKEGGKVAGTTQGYMQWAQVNDQLDACATIMNGEADFLAITNVQPSKLQSSFKRFMPLHHPAPNIFHGRKEYTNKAVSMLLDQKGAYLCILGHGGIGKTSIACTILHDLRIVSKFHDHRYFVSCEDINSTTSLVDTLCTAFGLEQVSVEKQDDLLIFLMDKYTTQPLLLILDNFESVWEMDPSNAEAVLAALGQVAGMSLLLTMRGTECPAGLNWTKPLLNIVGPLSPKAAYHTFKDICANEDEDLEKLLQELDYIPLAVTLMGHLALTEKPSHLLKRWRKEQTKLLSPEHDQGRLKNVDISICVSLKSSRMQSCSEALVLLSVISLLPSGVMAGELPTITPNILHHDFAATTLCQVGLAYYDSMQTLCVMSPVRAYIIQNHPPKQELINDLETVYFERAIEGAQRIGKEGNGDFMKTLWKSEANMEAIIGKALQANHNDEYEFIKKIQVALDWTSFLAWYGKPRETVIQLAVLVTQGKQDLYWWHSKCLLSLGGIQFTLNNNHQAQDTISAAQANFYDLGDECGVAQCLQSLGDMDKMLDNFHQAQEYLSTAHTKFTTLGEHYRAMQCLQSLGYIEHRLGHSKKAQDMVSIALTKFEAIGNHHRVAQCLQHLGDIHCALDDPQQALDVTSAAQVKFHALGDQLGVAQCQKTKGGIQYRLGNYSQAQTVLSEAQTIFDGIGNQLGVAWCLRDLGYIQLNLDNYQQAQDMFSMALTKFEDIGNDSRVAQCLQLLGNIHCMLKNYQQAQDMTATAQAKFDALGDPFGVAQCQQCLGGIQYALGNYSEAQTVLSAAQITFDTIGHQFEAACCLKELGHVQCNLNDYKQAMDMFSLAQVTFEAVGSHNSAAQCLQLLGDIHCTLNNHEEAQDIIFAAQAKFDVLGDQFRVSQCLKNQGDVQLMAHNFQKAQDMFFKAKTKFAAIGCQLEVAECLMSLAEVYIILYSLDDCEKALDMISMAQSIFEDIGNHSMAAWSLRILGDIHYTQGEFQKAQKILSTAQAKFEATGNQYGVAHCLYIQGDIQYILNNHQQAQDMISIAHTIFGNIGEQVTAAACQQRLKELKQGTYDKRILQHATNMISYVMKIFSQVCPIRVLQMA